MMKTGRLHRGCREGSTASLALTQLTLAIPCLLLLAAWGPQCIADTPGSPAPTAGHSNDSSHNSTTHDNSTADGHNTTGQNHTGGHKKHQHHVHVVALDFEMVHEPLIFTVVVLLAGLCKIGFHHADFLSSKIPESCMLILLGTVFGAIIQATGLSQDLPDLFSPRKFFIFLLPPIILESAYSLYDRTFSENLGTVLLFAVVGTIISFFLVGLSLYGLMLCGALGPVPEMTLVQILVFSALIVAVDPVAVLAVFAEIGVNDVLYFIVFGESLLNDGVTVVLYKVMQALNLMDVIPADQFILGIVKFLVVCFGGLLIGVVAGVLSALLTRLTTHVGVTQPLVIYTMAYFGFLVSELFEVSGIISIIGCGLVQRHYAFSNISHKSHTTVKYFTKVLASASEIIIFLFLGLELISDQHEWNTGFVLWTLLLCTVYRFIVTFGLACLINRFDTMRVRLIGYDEMFMIAFGGLRGAVAFSLAALLDENDLPMKRMFVTTTMAIVIFTVFVQGITIKPLVKLLAIRLAPEKNTSMYCELSSHVTDHLLAGIENVVGMHGRNHFREKVEQLDNEYIRKWLMNDPDPIDTSLEDFYNKIVIKEHYKNLKLCGAANVPESANIPRIDTSMYLNTLNEDEEVPVVAERTLTDIDETAQAVSPSPSLRPSPVMRHRDAVSPVLRRRRTSSFRPDHPVDDLNTLRCLLVSQRTSRVNLHNHYDRNLTFDQTNNLQAAIVERSSHNRRLQHLMSTTTQPKGLDRCMSWKEKDSQIAVKRNMGVTGMANRKVGGNRAVSLDLGANSASYRPVLTTPQSSLTATTPVTAGLDSVFEENEEHADDAGMTWPTVQPAETSPKEEHADDAGMTWPTVQPAETSPKEEHADDAGMTWPTVQPAETSPKEEHADDAGMTWPTVQPAETSPKEGEGGDEEEDEAEGPGSSGKPEESQPLMGSGPQVPTVVVEEGGIRRGADSKTSRHRLTRQDDLLSSGDDVV